MSKVPQEGATYAMLLCTHPPTSKAAPAPLSTSSWPSDMLDIPWTPTLYLDESGDPNPRSASEEYPVFVLGGVICDEHYADTVVRAALNSIKQDLFGRADFPLHTAEFKRNLGPFRVLKDDLALRAVLRSRILQVLRELDYTVLACAVHRDYADAQGGQADVDRYPLVLQALVEQFCDVIGQRGEHDEPSGRIIVESRRPRDDRAVMREWESMLDRGTTSVRGPVIKRRIRSLSVRPKSDLIPGLELADLVVSPVGRYAIGKPPVAEWEAVSEKMRQGPNGQIAGYGLIKLGQPNR